MFCAGSSILSSQLADIFLDMFLIYFQAWFIFVYVKQQLFTYFKQQLFTYVKQQLFAHTSANSIVRLQQPICYLFCVRFINCFPQLFCLNFSTTISASIFVFCNHVSKQTSNQFRQPLHFFYDQGHLHTAKHFFP